MPGQTERATRRRWATRSDREALDRGRMDGRPTRRFWHSAEGEVRRVLGFDCSSPQNEDTPYWWVPSVGASCAVGHTLFDHLDDAVEHATAALRVQQARIDARWRDLMHYLVEA